jgi:hypothetical protein
VYGNFVGARAILLGDVGGDDEDELLRIEDNAVWVYDL